MFLGTYTPRLDDKGRLALPAKFRPELEGGLVICKGLDRCLFVFPTAEFRNFTKAIGEAPISDKRVRNYGRTLFAGASNEVLDSQGRVTVPPQLRDYGNLSKDVVVVGVNTRLEVWESEAWATWSADADTAFADIAEEVLPGYF
ncbi:MAG TPA: division/cell wall cluster transcriptional repressor MraZ [Jatrophihabitans sp.]|jgi:MraZ protein